MFESRWSSYGIAILLALPIYYIDSSFTYLAFAVVVFAWAFYKIGKKAFLLAALLPLLWFGGWHYWLLCDEHRTKECCAEMYGELAGDSVHS